MAIEITPQKKDIKIIFQKVILYIGIFLLVFEFSLFFILSYYNKKISQEIIDIEKKLSKTEEENILEKEVLSVKKQIDDWEKIVKDYKKSLNFFEFLEKYTHPDVSFSKMSLSVKDNNVSLSGKAKSFDVLGQQVMILKDIDEIESVNVSSASLNRERSIDFSISINLKPSIFLSNNN
jgi:uncharacterized protein YeeX (DUF496 family)